MAVTHRIWALISEEIVQNIIVCDTYPMADMLAKQTIGVEAFAIEITQIPTAIGHSYLDGVFKDKQGNVIEHLPSLDETLIKLEEQTKKVEVQEQAITELSMFVATLGV